MTAVAEVITLVSADTRNAVDALAPPVANTVAGTIAPEIFSIMHIDAAATFGDALSSFADESAAMPTLRAAAEHSNARAWALTGLVLAADAVIIARYRKQRATAFANH